MTLDTIFPTVEPWPAETLMAVDEIETFAPSINSEIELPEGATLEEALATPGGLAAFCRRERRRRQKAGLSA